MATMKVLLTRKWSDWDVGDVVELEHAKALRVIAKRYGVEHQPVKRLDRSPVVETADAPPVAEKAIVTPKRQSKAMRKAGK